MDRTASILASTITDQNGNFSFAPGAYTCPQSDTPVYLLGIGGNAGSGNNGSVVQAAALGTCANAKNSFVVMNEVTTAATAFVLSHFFSTTLGGVNGANDWFGGPSTSSGGTTVYSQGLVMGSEVTLPTIVNNGCGPGQPDPEWVYGRVAEDQHDCEHPGDVREQLGLDELDRDAYAVRKAFQLDGELSGDAALRHTAGSGADGAVSHDPGE